MKVLKGFCFKLMPTSVQEEEFRHYAGACRWVRIDRFFPSSKLHLVCGTLNHLSLSDRVFVCQGCGALVERDPNATHNIKYRGLVELLLPVGQPGVYARGLGVSPANGGQSGLKRESHGF